MSPHHIEPILRISHELVAKPLDTSMLAPFDTLQIDTFLDHLPQRAQLPQERDSLAHGLQNIVNLCLRCESADAEPDTAVCILVAVPQSSKYVARL